MTTTISIARHCCACSVVCYHIGPVMLCDAHKPLAAAPNPVVDPVGEIGPSYRDQIAALQAERNCLAAAVERAVPVLEAARAYCAAEARYEEPGGIARLHDAVDTLAAAVAALDTDREETRDR